MVNLCKKYEENRRKNALNCKLKRRSYKKLNYHYKYDIYHFNIHYLDWIKHTFKFYD